jgi:hypothetical protein
MCFTEQPPQLFLSKIFKVPISNYASLQKEAAFVHDIILRGFLDSTCGQIYFEKFE